MSNFIVRTITGIIILACTIFLIYTGGYSLLFTIMALSLIGIYELKNTLKSKDYNMNLPLAYIFSAILIYFSWIDYPNIELYILSTYMMIILILTIFDIFDFKSALLQIFSILYIPLSFSAFFKLEGTFYIWLIFICAWGTDTFAYLVGSLIGKHKLIEKVSPKKSVEGAIGGIVGAAFLTFVVATIFNISNIVPLIIITIFGSLIAQLGDLTASKIKRYSNTKDFGFIFIGHGGVLDRFDSVLFVAPFIFVVTSIFLG